MKATSREPTQPGLLHNMSVPSTSRITVARARLPGRRFAVNLEKAFGHKAEKIRERLARGGWRAAFGLLNPRSAKRRRQKNRRRTPDDLERLLRQALKDAAIPDRLGVFVDEGPAPTGATSLSPAAALAVLARRSGPLYLPSRRLEPSLVDPRRPLVLFFPEE